MAEETAGPFVEYLRWTFRPIKAAHGRAERLWGWVKRALPTATSTITGAVAGVLLHNGWLLLSGIAVGLAATFLFSGYRLMARLRQPEFDATLELSWWINKTKGERDHIVASVAHELDTAEFEAWTEWEGFWPEYDRAAAPWASTGTNRSQVTAGFPDSVHLLAVRQFNDGSDWMVDLIPSDHPKDTAGQPETLVLTLRRIEPPGILVQRFPITTGLLDDLSSKSRRNEGAGG